MRTFSTDLDIIDLASAGFHVSQAGSTLAACDILQSYGKHRSGIRSDGLVKAMVEVREGKEATARRRLHLPASLLAGVASVSERSVR